MLPREGRLVSRVGRGTYVARPREGGGALVDLRQPAARRRRPRRSTCRSASPAPSAPARSTSRRACRSSTPRSRPRSAAELEAVVREEGARLFRYGPPRGDLGLRELVADAWRGAGSRRPRAHPGHDLRPAGDRPGGARAGRARRRVLCETPTYAGAIDSLSPRAPASCRCRRRPRPAGRARGGGGGGGAARRPLRQPDRQQRDRNGAAAERRRALAALAAETGLVVIEDDTGAELVHDGPVPPPVAAGDPEAPVVLVKSYAKTVLPGLRLGVISRRRTSSGACWRPSWSPTATRRRRSPRALAGYLARPEAAAPPRAHAAALPRAPRRLPALARAPARRARDLARAGAPASTSGCGCPTAYRRRRSSRAASSAA